ncbi:MAG: Uma2 family endonuclease [Isosphaeraceae bacterium]
MNPTSTTWKEVDLEYPESDGLPMAENTTQFRWIVTIKEGIAYLFRDREDVFVAGDLFWYPAQGHREIRTAPDTMVVFGRPAGDRRSYKQWEEGGIPPQVVFEVLSPGNTAEEMREKRRFYERYGVEEYYVYDPDENELEGWRRAGTELTPIAEMAGWTSPRLGLTFEPGGEELRLIRPDGRALETFREACERAEAEGLRAEEERQRAEAEGRRAEIERRRAEAEMRRAEESALRAESAEQRAQRLAAQLRALGIDPDA